MNNTQKYNRDDIIKLINSTELEVSKASEQLEDYNNPDWENLKQNVFNLRDKLSALEEQYKDCVPVLNISRNPFNNKIISHSIDIFGLDGFWWSNEAPIRKFEDPSPEYLLMSGALKLNKPVEYTEFLVKPGPQVPFLVEEIISHPLVKAVISCLKIGQHTAYPIFYFSEKLGLSIPLENVWGTNEYYLINPGSSNTWAESDYTEDDYVFDLVPWIKEGKLFWIFPEDDTLTLRNSIDDCPYLNLSGSRFNSYLLKGKYWCYDNNEGKTKNNNNIEPQDDEDSNIV